MRRTAVLLACLLALAGCSGSGGEPAKPTSTVTVTATPSLSAAEARTACVDAWAGVLLADADASVDDPPEECGSVPEGEQLDAYMRGMAQRNKVNQDAMRECLDDPSCTALPVP